MRVSAVNLSCRAPSAVDRTAIEQPPLQKRSDDMAMLRFVQKRAAEHPETPEKLLNMHKRARTNARAMPLDQVELASDEALVAELRTLKRRIGSTLDQLDMRSGRERKRLRSLLAPSLNSQIERYKQVRAEVKSRPDLHPYDLKKYSSVYAE